MAVLIDIPNLKKRIVEIAKTYVPSEPPHFIENDAEVGFLGNLIRQIVSNIRTKDPVYWRKSGIRWVPSAEFFACLEKVKKNTRELGKGAFGSVFNVPSDTCIKNIPPGVEHVGIKLEVIKQFDINQEPERVKEVVKIAKKANKLGLGPAIYDVFVTENALGFTVIVKVFETINGKTWRDTVWESPQAKSSSVAKLKAAIHKLNNAGIIHHDLHSGNVMIDDTGKIYIIDYDRAQFVENEEKWQITEFNETVPGPWTPSGLMTDDGILYIYTKLVEAGDIKLKEEKASVDVTVKTNNNRGRTIRKKKAKAKND